MGATRDPQLPSTLIAGAKPATCVRCGERFSCGAHAASCSCQTLPALDLAQRASDLIARGCLCVNCLSLAVAAQKVA